MQKIVGLALVLTSTLTKVVLETLAKFKPEALIKRDEKGNALFVVQYGNTAAIGSNGVQYNAVDADGYAQLTLMIPSSVKAEDRLQYVVDNYGKALFQLNDWELSVLDAYNILAAQFAAVEDSIEVE